MKRTLIALLLLLCMLPVCAWAEQITITFDGNGATTGTMDAVIWQAESTYYLPWCQFECEGHNFAGWLINGEGNPVQAGDTISVMADMNLVAAWEPRIYTVHFSAGIGSDQTNSAGLIMEEKYGVGFELPDPGTLNFTCDYHEFIGWQDQTNENGKIYAAGDIFDGFVPTCFTNLVAQWKPMEFKVTFLPGEGGTGNMTDGVATYGYPYNLPECAFTAPEGHEFKVWLLNGEETPVGTSLLAKEDTTVTALWQRKTYTVTYKLEDGMGGVRPVEDVPHGQTVKLAQPPAVDEKWVFDGWVIDGKTYSAGDSITVTDDVTVTAKWKVRAVRITYVNDAGETLLTDDSLTYGRNHRVLSLENLNAQLEDGKKLTVPEGYLFRGWRVLDDTGENINTAGANDELPVYGIWTLKPDWKLDNTPKMYPVVYQANGGSGYMNSVQVKENNKHTLRECGFTAPAGKRFKAWRVNGEEYAPGTQIVVSEQTNVYAIWQEIKTYRLTFVDGNDTSKTFERTVKENESFVLPTSDDCGFAPLSGQVFAYWVTDDGEAQLDAGTHFSGASTDMIFTAVWKLNEKTETRVEQKSMDSLTDEEAEKMLGEMPDEVDTVEEVVTRLKVAAVKKGFDEKKVEVRDVTLAYSVDGGKNWIPATEENFPTKGITVALDLPEGTNAADYEFSVTHMFTVNSERLGTKAGATETPEVTIRDGKIVVTLTGLSPVSIAWKEKPLDVDLPKTGDASCLMGWIALLGASGAGLAGMKRRKK